jgi:peptide/nickel transport system ATP-binding protein
MSATPVLELESLEARIVTGAGATPVLRGVSLRLEPGRIHGLVGESGGGKTLVCTALIGILPAAVRLTGGKIRFEGRDVLALAAGQRRALLGRSIAMILQNPMTALNPAYRIREQITDVLRLHLGLSGKASPRRALELLASVHIRDPERVMRLFPHELSGGMCQRVAISIAFACEPRLIVADEPTTALDVTVQHQILRLIRDMQRRTGTSVLFVTHDLGIVAKLCDEVSVLHAGRVLDSGPVERVFSPGARHEYTSALLAAAPRYDRPEQPVRPIPAALRERLLSEVQAYDRACAHAAHA